MKEYDRSKQTYKGAPIKLISFLIEDQRIKPGDAYKLLNKKKVFVNGSKVGVNFKIKSGDIITTNKCQDCLTIAEPKKNKIIESLDFLKSLIIFEDQYILVLNKPIKWATQGGVNCFKNIDDLVKPYYENLHLVHRLDKDTSGLLLLAKGKNIAKELGKLFKERKIKKEYLAIINKINKGVWDHLSYIPKSDKEDQQEQISYNSETRFKKLGDFDIEGLINFNILQGLGSSNIQKQNSEVSLIKAEPITGRKHQIRLHLRELGFPILGDTKYNGDKTTRMMLHSFRINFNLLGKTYDLRCPWQDINIPILEDSL